MRYRKSVFRSLAMVTQLGLCVLTPTVLGVLAGGWLDSRYGTKLTLVLLVLGVLGGGRGAYVMAKRLIVQEGREAKAEQERRMREVLADAETSARKPKLVSRTYTVSQPEEDIRGAAAGGSDQADGMDSGAARTAASGEREAVPSGEDSA